MTSCLNVGEFGLPLENECLLDSDSNFTFQQTGQLRTPQRVLARVLTLLASDLMSPFCSDMAAYLHIPHSQTKIDKGILSVGRRPKSPYLYSSHPLRESYFEDIIERKVILYTVIYVLIYY